MTLKLPEQKNWIKLHSTKRYNAVWIIIYIVWRVTWTSTEAASVWLLILAPTDTKIISVRSLLIGPVVLCSAVVRGRDVSRKTKTVSSIDPERRLFKWLIFSDPFMDRWSQSRKKVITWWWIFVGYFFRSYVCHTIHSFLLRQRVLKMQNHHQQFMQQFMQRPEKRRREKATTKMNKQRLKN